MTPWSPSAARVLVVGARKGSLGHEVACQLKNRGCTVTTAGISGEEDFSFDIFDLHEHHALMEEVDPTHVVCTVGANEGGPIYHPDWWQLASDLMEINYIQPMRLLTSFSGHLSGMPGSFVAISSNSAHIARSESAAYCASKAALSMALRCAARDYARAGIPLRVWGYEPGALAGTPMTQSVASRLPAGTPMSRMLVRPEGLPVGRLGRVIARDLLEAEDLLHGTMIRIDAGEQ